MFNMGSLWCHRLFLLSLVVIFLSKSIAGDTCDENKAKLSEDANLCDVVIAVVNETMSIPKMGHVIDISNLEKITTSHRGSPHSMMYTVYRYLSNAMQTIEHRKRQFTLHLKNIPGRYAETVSNINYFLECFQILSLKKKADRLKQADRVLHIEHGVHKWLFELNHMLMGQYMFSGDLQQPVLFRIIDELSMKLGCSDEYKRTLDTVWQEMMILQCQGFLLWAHALHIKGKGSGFLAHHYKTTLCNQVNKLKEDTCDITVKESTNINCTGGYYSYRDAKFLPRCKPNHYLSMKQMRAFITCKDKEVECLPCDCNPFGSNRAECSDGTGQCYCSKNSYHGRTCSDRDCHWTSWSTWGNCSKPCGYGVKMRGRVHAIHKEENGQACEGDFHMTETCFDKCCNKEFNCVSSQKCIPENSVCNAIKDCTNAEDEKNCSSCTTLFDHNLLHVDRYMLRQNMRCINSKAVSFFNFLNSNVSSNLDLRYSCCQLKRNVCNTRSYRMTFSNQKDYFGLHKYPFQCKHNGMIQMMFTSRVSTSTRRYMSCCEIKESFHEKVICYMDHSPYTEVGRSIISNLPGKGVKCKDGYYLNMLKIVYDKSLKHWGFLFRCCNVLY